MPTTPSPVPDAAFPRPGTSTWVETARARVHVVDEGSGPTLLMLHGNPTWSYEYREVIRALAPAFRCVAVDHPGFGLSEAEPGYGYRAEEHADVLTEVVAALDLRDYTLVAHDWGGPIGLAAALSEPDRLAGLALANTWAWPVTGDKHFERFARLMGGPVGRFGARHANLVVGAMIPAGHRRRRPRQAELRRYREVLATPERRLASAVLPAEIVDAAPFLARVEAGLPSLAHLPALLVWADRDIAFRRIELDRWRTVLPRASVVELAGVGHFVPSDAPDELAGAVAAWHASTLGTGAPVSNPGRGAGQS